ncbi:HAD-IIB family hydrolase [Halomonas sp. M20]|uniref:HAD-IIB family hydrolase n=1 Tax=Halomonas sp. M20 TaxID=2763264 RepID=UPI001D0AAD81|nr:HAD-IIB family hydrolase [Halomonas sp. M20]
MRSFADADFDLLAHVDVVLTDVDDTLTRHGKLAPGTLDAMAELMAAGIRVIPVTGGCAGWCDHIVRAWPVSAVIGESGAFRFRLNAHGRLEQRFIRPLNELQAEQRQLLRIAEQALQQVPEARLAADQPYRLVDVAVDHAQDIGPLSSEQVAALIARFHEAGASARASSIHVNAWFGDHDKAAMAGRLLEEDLGLNTRDRARRVLFIGDAPNDEPLFRDVSLSVGVANITPHLARLVHTPRWLCRASHGEGFVEMATGLLAARMRPFNE